MGRYVLLYCCIYLLALIKICQDAFDALAAAVGCGEDSNKLNCLRSVPLDVLQPAVDATDGVFSETVRNWPVILSKQVIHIFLQALHLSWRPSADGVFLTDNPQKLVQEGKVADIPIVAGTWPWRIYVSIQPAHNALGNVDDEGTLFSVGKVGSIR